MVVLVAAVVMLVLVVLGEWHRRRAAQSPMR